MGTDESFSLRLTATEVERFLLNAPENVVLAVHDLTHKIMNDRSGRGVAPPERRLRKARRIIDASGR